MKVNKKQNPSKNDVLRMQKWNGKGTAPNGHKTSHQQKRQQHSIRLHGYHPIQIRGKSSASKKPPVARRLFATPEPKETVQVLWKQYRATKPGSKAYFSTAIDLGDALLQNDRACSKHQDESICTKNTNCVWVRRWLSIFRGGSCVGKHSQKLSLQSIGQKDIQRITEKYNHLNNLAIKHLLVPQSDEEEEWLFLGAVIRSLFRLAAIGGEAMDANMRIEMYKHNKKLSASERNRLIAKETSRILSSRRQWLEYMKTASWMVVGVVGAIAAWKLGTNTLDTLVSLRKSDIDVVLAKAKLQEAITKTERARATIEEHRIGVEEKKAKAAIAKATGDIGKATAKAIQTGLTEWSPTATLKSVASIVGPIANSLAVIFGK